MKQVPVPPVLGMQAENYGITVAGVEVTDANAGNITGDNITDGTVSFDAQTNTLTLNNATINMSEISGQYAVESSIDYLKVKLLA